MYKLFFSLIFLTVALIPQSSENAEITKDEIFAHIKYLASDELEGRSPGSGKDILAANYIRNELKKAGVILLAEDGFQHFEVGAGTEVSNKSTLVFNGIAGTFGVDFTPLAISSKGKVEAEVVFCGFGFSIDDTKLKVNNFASGVKGKWVMVLRGAPKNESLKDVLDKNSTLRKKILTAKDNGAAGIIFVNGYQFAKQDELISTKQGSGEPDAGIPAISISRELADKLLAQSGKTIKSLEDQLLFDVKNDVSFSTGIMLSSDAIVTKTKKPTVNVVALIEGNDPVLKNEYVIIGAHFDHLGWGGPGTGSRRPDTIAIHNGADDNASGTSTIIEVFEKLAVNKASLKRSVVFLAFGAEEMGLLGSKYFTENPLKELRNAKLMLNLDMVGRLNPTTKVLTLGGTGTAVEFDSFLDKHIKSSGMEIKKSPEGYGPSDHASFYAKDIPVLFLFTGVHDDYHTPTDDYEKINSEGAATIGNLTYNIAYDVAANGVTLTYKEAGPKEKSGDTPAYKVSLGIMPDMAASDVVGVKAEAVIPDRPAHKAGMLKGDIIIAINSKPVKDLYEYMERLAELKKGDLVNVLVVRGTEKLTLKVQL